MARKETTSKKKIFHGVMKRAVEMDVDHVNIVYHRPAEIVETILGYPKLGRIIAVSCGRRRPASKQQDGQ